ncbi:unnamed protein product [Prorocentrum cordatum]|uniref:Uncharacterized protein n=1 Tax=Prorocentrum cordatum TaxID=2364126 RepID=A0ABN9WIN4_9DINO|nr:unnamed protein product [Polarella glacialis]
MVHAACGTKKVQYPNRSIFPAERTSVKKKLIDQFKLEDNSETRAWEIAAGTDSSMAALVGRLRESIAPKKIATSPSRKRGRQEICGDAEADAEPAVSVVDANRRAGRAVVDGGARCDSSGCSLVKELLCNMLGSVFLRAPISRMHLSHLGDAYLTLVSDEAGVVKVADIFQKTAALTRFDLWGRVVPREVAVNINAGDLVHLGECHGVDLYLTPLGPVVCGKSESCYACMVEPTKLPVAPKAKAKAKAKRFVLTVSGQSVMFKCNMPLICQTEGMDPTSLPLRRERLGLDDGVVGLDGSARPSKKQEVSTSLAFAGE